MLKTYQLTDFNRFSQAIFNVESVLLSKHS